MTATTDPGPTSMLLGVMKSYLAEIQRCEKAAATNHGVVARKNARAEGVTDTAISACYATRDGTDLCLGPMS